MSEIENRKEQQLISYMLLRRCIGFLGIGLPIMLIVSSVLYGECNFIQSSISDYYHTRMRNIFVGALCAVAFFMFTYKGYDIKDSIAGNLASFFALGVVFFPTYIDTESTCVIQCITYEPWVSVMHFTFAGLFFSVLIYFCLFLFIRSDHKKHEKSKAKRKRDFMFSICGYVMIACIILIAIYIAYLRNKYPVLEQFDPIFWLETIALFAFGTSWLTKGQFLFEDEKA